MDRVKSVKELIKEMKDFSVLAIDLAYCSILFNSKETASEVIKIAQKMEALRTELEKTVLKAVTSGVDESQLIGVLRLGDYVEGIGSIAGEMAKKAIEGKIHEVEKSALSEAEERFFRLKADSELAKRTVQEIGTLKNIWIIAIKRGREWIYNPTGKIVLKKGDIVFGRG